MVTPGFLKGIRGKLIAIFILIKVIPLLLLAWFAWQATTELGKEVSDSAGDMADAMVNTLKAVGQTASEDSIRALDLRSREAIEAITTTTARQIADFLHDRDRDIRQASAIEPSEAAYHRFLDDRTRTLHRHAPWVLADDGKRWVPAAAVEREAKVTRPVLADNARDFHARPPEYLGETERRPLFVEMTYLGLDGQERLKITRGDLMEKSLKNVVDRNNTFVRAETYFSALKTLKPGEIYVSDVIGAYVPTQLIGPYLPESLEKAGKPFQPETSAYAGTENPVGKRFRGIVRWATPVVSSGQITGYVTLALDHDHIRQFTDRLMPTEARHTPIADAIQGNYAFLWDYKSRAISHPRDYFIVGYDPDTGLPATPWMDEELYGEWQQSGLPSHQFLAGIPPFRAQSLQHKPARALVKAGTVGLDCRYLNFSPQCDGWNAITEHGGSGSFVIFFSGLWKLTTAAAIPYYTGQYSNSPMGFGFVTIGANVDEFHRAATDTAQKIDTLIADSNIRLGERRSGLLDGIAQNLKSTAIGLWGSTLVMVILVILIAVWMANTLTRRITDMIAGIRAFQGGERGRRLDARSADEMGELAASFNRMADEVEHSFQRLEEARDKAEEASRMKSTFVATMSHELRTPLNGILGFAEILKSDAPDPEHRQYAGIIKESGEHLLALVNDVLDMSKIEAGEMQYKFSAAPLADLVRSAAAVHAAPAGAKGLRFELELADDLPPTLHTDATRLKQILNNLLSNAVKFTAQGFVRLTVRRNQAGITFVVADSGPGIAPEEQARVFEKFKQADNFLTREQGGTGLGLHIARQMARQMGGEVTLDAVPGSGATFTLSMPILPPHVE